MSVLSAIIVALFSGLDAGFEYSSFIDRMDTNMGVHDADVIVSYTPSFFNKMSPSGSIDGIAPTDSVNLLTEPMEKEPVTILTLNARDHSKLRSNLSNEPPNPPRNVRVSSTSYLNINLQWDLEMNHVTSNQYIIEWSSDNRSCGFLLVPTCTYLYRIRTISLEDYRSTPAYTGHFARVR